MSIDLQFQNFPSNVCLLLTGPREPLLSRRVCLMSGRPRTAEWVSVICSTTWRAGRPTRGRSCSCPSWPAAGSAAAPPPASRSCSPPRWAPGSSCSIRSVYIHTYSHHTSGAGDVTNYDPPLESRLQRLKSKLVNYIVWLLEEFVYDVPIVYYTLFFLSWKTLDHRYMASLGLKDSISAFQIDRFVLRICWPVYSVGMPALLTAE